MDNLTTLLAYLKLHWAYISAVTVLVVTALANHRVGNPSVQLLWQVLLDVLAPKVQAGASARISFTGRAFKTPMGLKVPFLMRSHHGAATVKGTSGPTAASIIFLFLVGSVSSCGTSGGQAYSKCELNALPQTTQTVEACVVQAATGQGDVQATITACGLALLPAQFGCIVQAVLAWAKTSVPPAARVSPDMLRAVQNLQTWIAAHPTKAACSRVAL